jgi:thioredoxin
MMKRITFTCFFFFSVLLFLNCTSQHVPGIAEVHNVSVAEFEKLMMDENSLVLDVRTPEETESGTISQASTIDFYDPDFLKKIKVMDASKNILVYCKGGGRSAQAADLLVKNGFKNVYNLEGGISAWQSSGRKVSATSQSNDTHIQQMTISQFTVLLKQTDLVLVDFHTVWCSPCRKMAPIVDRLEKEYKSKAGILRIDVDKSSELATKYSIQAVPVFMLFKSGKEVWKHNGAIEESKLKDVIEKYL